jgi:hypothetical protein
MTNVLAAGMDDESTGVKRGELVVSVRQLARAFNWSHGMAQRFLALVVGPENVFCGDEAPEAGNIPGSNFRPQIRPQLFDQLRPPFTRRKTLLVRDLSGEAFCSFWLDQPM